MQPKVVTPANTLVVSLADAKKWASVDHDDDDDLIDGLIAIATAHFEGFHGVLGVSLIDTVWREQFDKFSRLIRLKNYPVQSVSSVTYLDSEGAEVTIDETSYELCEDGFGYYLVFLDGIHLESADDGRSFMTVDYVAGYGAAENVPTPIVTAIKMYVAELYERREAQSEKAELRCNPMIEGLINQYRRRSF